MHPDHEPYFQLTGPQRLHKALSTLEGLLIGLAADEAGTITDVAAVLDWLAALGPAAERHPFSEFAKVVREAAADGVLEPEEIADILWLARRLQKSGKGFRGLTSDMQRLQGVLAGVVADGQVTVAELNAIENWLEKNQKLRRTWPYEEVYGLLRSVMADGRIDDDEHRALLSFFGEFALTAEHRAVSAQPHEFVGAICAADPPLAFEGHSYCFTGASKRATRKEIGGVVTKLGGTFRKGVTKKVDFLVIGADGNPCWAYACYGRKVEKAIQLRQSGSPILLVHETDFWKATEGRV